MQTTATLPQKKFSLHGGPQTEIAESNADIAIYGGGAGSGKTFYEVALPLYHIDNPHFNALIFRRVQEQIRQIGGLWDATKKVYPYFGASSREQQLDWKFPSGAVVKLDSMQHEKDKEQFLGSEICYLEFDELTTFTESQFFYMMSRNRSTCGVKPIIRASCNPDSRSWVARFISWWIDPATGFPIKERSGVKRYFIRDEDDIIWGNSRWELKKRYPSSQPKSLTFVPALLADNPTLVREDPNYLSNLMAMPKIERERLLSGNWKISESSIIDVAWLRYFDMRGQIINAIIGGRLISIDERQCRRFATIDTAGSSRDKLDESKGKPCSWSVCAVWDYWHAANVLFLRHVWRDRVSWNALKERVPQVLRTWQVPKAYIENAHVGPALYDELAGINRELIGPVIQGMTDSNRGAKLERAIASGMLSRFEDELLVLPREDLPWKKPYESEITMWGGMPDETADQIDVTSYASYACRQESNGWGGVVNVPMKGVGF